MTAAASDRSEARETALFGLIIGFLNRSMPASGAGVVLRGRGAVASLGCVAPERAADGFGKVGVVLAGDANAGRNRGGLNVLGARPCSYFPFHLQEWEFVKRRR